jgi:hypothetical protein
MAQAAAAASLWTLDTSQLPYTASSISAIWDDFQKCTTRDSWGFESSVMTTQYVVAYYNARLAEDTRRAGPFPRLIELNPYNSSGHELEIADAMLRDRIIADAASANAAVRLHIAFGPCGDRHLVAQYTAILNPLTNSLSYKRAAVV